MQIGLNGKGTAGRRKIWAVVIGIAVIGFTLCLKSGEAGLLSPVETGRNLLLWLRLSAARLLNLPMWLERDRYLAAHPFYLMTVARAKNTALTFLSGAILAAAGVVYQNVFRNPMASPTMLGVTGGVNLGLLILVLCYSGQVYFMTTQRYLLCYGMALVMLVLVFACAKLIGGRKRNLTDLLLAGVMLNQIVNVFITYYRYVMSDQDLEVYMELTTRGFSSNTSVSFSVVSFAVLAVTTLIGLVPLWLMRFSFTAISFSNEEAYSMGVNPKLIRGVSLVCVTLLVAAAVLHCGSVGLLALVVPHLCRYWYGARFAPLLSASIYFGGVILVLCRAVSSLLYLDELGSFPLGPLVSIAAIPILAAALLTKRRGWE